MQTSTPVFISGYNKSGTTLFLALLDSHPQLAVLPEELHFFKTVLFAKDRRSAISEATGFRIFMDDSYLAEWSQGKSWFKAGYPEYDKKLFCECFDELSVEQLAPRDLLKSLFRCYVWADNIDFDERRYWVSKTTQDEINFPIMRDMFKDLHFFYIVRDPRDVWSSYVKRKNIAYGETQNRETEFLKFVCEWKVQVNQAKKFSNHHTNFHIIRYEDLICNTRETIGKVADILGITFEQILLRPTRHRNPWGGNSAFADSFQSLSKEPIGRYKMILPIVEQESLIVMLGRELTDFHYPVDIEFLGGVAVPKKLKHSFRWKILLTRLNYVLKKEIRYMQYAIGR